MVGKKLGFLGAPRDLKHTQEIRKILANTCHELIQKTRETPSNMHQTLNKKKDAKKSQQFSKKKTVTPEWHLWMREFGGLDLSLSQWLFFVAMSLYLHAYVSPRHLSSPQSGSSSVHRSTERRRKMGCKNQVIPCKCATWCLLEYVRMHVENDYMYISLYTLINLYSCIYIYT